MGRSIFVSLGLLVVALSLSGAGADHHCPPDWSSFNEFCYKVFNTSMTWNNAESFCMKQQKNSHLASIHGEIEAKFLQRLAIHGASLRSSVWIGLSDPEKRGNWKWSDGSTVIYRAWMQGEPNNHANMQYCVMLSVWPHYFRWNDQDCRSRHNFVCKYQPSPEGIVSALQTRK